MIERYYELANEIILLAVEDLRGALERYSMYPTEENRNLVEHEKAFFYSEWYDCLTRVDADDIVKPIMRQYGMEE